MRACNRQLSQHEYHFQHIQDDKYSRAAVIDISTKCWATKVIELGKCTHANIHREASGIISMLVIILIHLLVPGEITNLNY